jgi:hypothetical protein
LLRHGAHRNAREIFFSPATPMLRSAGRREGIKLDGMKRALPALPAALCLAYVVALAACTSLPRHTAAPYDRDAAKAAEIERFAAEWCSEGGPPAGPPPRPFRFDGCSWWPDGDWRDCCQTHDYAYWCGGSAADRAAADERLRACVAEKQGDAFGRLMWLGVRVGGHPRVPLYFRWGYGHAYSGCYGEQDGRR